MAEEIALIDNKGEYVGLTFTGVYRTSRAGLVEMWVYAAAEEGLYMGKWWHIPLPVFTEWWE